MREMWALGMPEQATLIAILLGVLPANLYPFVLALVKWNESRIGRAMMFKGISLLLVFDLGLLSLFWTDPELFPWFVLFADSFLVFAVYYQFLTVVDILRDEERRKKTGGRRKRVDRTSPGVE